MPIHMRYKSSMRCIFRSLIVNISVQWDTTATPKAKAFPCLQGVVAEEHDSRLMRDGFSYLFQLPKMDSQSPWIELICSWFLGDDCTHAQPNAKTKIFISHMMHFQINSNFWNSCFIQISQKACQIEKRKKPNNIWYRNHTWYIFSSPIMEISALRSSVTTKKTETVHMLEKLPVNHMWYPPYTWSTSISALIIEITAH